MYTRILFRVFGWIKAHRTCSVEFSYRHGKRAHFIALVLPCSVGLVATQFLSLPCCGRSLMLLVLMSPWFLRTRTHRSFFPITWTVGIVQSSWKTRYLISVCSSAASSELLWLCLASLTLSWWRSLWSTRWRVPRQATEWRLALHFGRPLSPTNFPCRVL